MLFRSHAPSKNLEIQLDHSHTCCHVGLIARRSAKPEKFGRLSRLHAPTCAAYVLGSFPRTATISSCVAHPLATCAVLSAMSTTDLPMKEIWLSTAISRASTRHLGFWLLLLASMEQPCACHASKFVMLSSMTSEKATSAGMSASHVSSVASSAPRHLVDH